MNAQIPIPVPFSKDISKMSIVDSGNIKIRYALNAVDIEKQETYDDLQQLELGDYISKYYSYLVYRSDSLCTDWKKQNPKAGNTPIAMGGLNDGNKWWSEYQWSEYFKDFTENVFTEYARLPFYLRRYDLRYSEDIHPQKWEIHDDTLTVAGYLCQKAICLFGGRNYTAWFTSDIPINNGPWKFGGLPGLILKVYDNDKLYVFECISIEKYKKKFPIKIFNDYKNRNSIDRKKLLKLYDNLHDDYYKTAGLTIISVERPKKSEILYQPLELE
jgi:GLPGLI family protein